MRHGIVVFRVVRHSPADAAGVLPGDIVTHVNGTEVRTVQSSFRQTTLPEFALPSLLTYGLANQTPEQNMLLGPFSSRAGRAWLLF